MSGGGGFKGGVGSGLGFSSDTWKGLEHEIMVCGSLAY